MAEPQQPIVQTPTNTQQQVTSQTPATKQKNPKRVAAGKAVAEKTRLAREAQKKSLIEAQSIIARAKSEDPPSVSEPVNPEPPSVVDPPPSKNVLTTTQWLSIISIVVSLAGVYYKREEIKKKVFATPPPRAPPPSPVDAAPPKGFSPMD